MRTHDGHFNSGSIAGLGDVNGDGDPDLCADVQNLFSSSSGSYVGIHSGVDGVDELVIGSAYQTSYKGSIYVYSGASGTLLYTLNGARKGTYFGDRVVDAGDMHGDGVHEIAVESHPVDGRTHVRVQFFRSDTGTRIASLPSELYIGADLAGGSDLDGDGRSEFLTTDFYDTDGSTWKGRAFVYRGDDLDLFANQPWFASSDPLELHSSPGTPGQIASIWLLAIDDSPFPLRIAGGTCDGDGDFSLSGTVPPGLPGIDLDLIAFGIDGSGHLLRSVITNVEFR